MGKNRNRESLIKTLASTVVHESLLKNTNKPESRHFLLNEITEYMGLTEKKIKQSHWSDDDKKYIREKTLIRVKGKIDGKYSDMSISIEEVEKLIDKNMKEMFEASE